MKKARSHHPLKFKDSKNQSRKTPWLNLDHRLWHEVKTHGLQKHFFLVAVSGGGDSVALLRSCARVLDPSQLMAFHFHHGPGSQKKARDEAQRFVESLCGEQKIPLIVRQCERELCNEGEFRDARWKALREVFKQKSVENQGVMVLAHHSQDLLETRLLRLLRGTGPAGSIAMEVLKASVFRPFLKESPQDLRESLHQVNQGWWEDPSNQSLGPQRNWLRHRWLKDLEARQQGSVFRLGQSLQLWAEELNREDEIALDQGPVLFRSSYLCHSLEGKKRLLARWFYSQNFRHFSQAHIEEIVKRLDKGQNVLTFSVGPVTLLVDAMHIRVEERKKIKSKS